uniref:ATP synthase subunit a, sodium ion specific n=1 Tax=Propionigenium modestum TaxID=2333 RepID=ATP6_PROMO|nr:RecName: Full=ATP synthase subunit a, sodium ion specific; AltName: Full=ATP synthase F0 sector subunit a; AltName: Full=F-ATPase subunit 6 [Propionigenium modestum]CAA38579.1 ATPase a subunit [Propionigenium modestum]CAA46894.1 ATPase a subunit [Propionigenium modestum]
MKKMGPIILAVVIAIGTFALKMMGVIGFKTPPLVEGPKIMFYVPLPEAMHDFPFAMEMASGVYGFPVTITVISTWFVMLFLIMVFRWSSKNLEVVPERKQAFFETIYGFLDDLYGQLLGNWKKKYFTYIGTLFLFLLISNIVSFFPIPGFSSENGVFSIAPALRTPTADLNTTVGLALLTTYSFIAASFRTSGFFGFFKGLFEPMPLMFPINLAGEFAKPTNISIRLFGNMFAGMVILGLLYKAAPVLIPAPLHLYFDLFSGVVQSFVFIMLTMVYIQGSIGDAEYLED